MDNFSITVWKEEDGNWCYQVDGDPRVYVYGTKRSMLTKVEKELDKHYGIVKADE